MIHTSRKAYLYRMVRNACLKYLKKADLQDSLDFTRFQAALFLQDEDYHTKVAREGGLLKKLFQVVDTFSEQKKKIFIMRYMEELKYEEIAQELGISIGAVKKQLHRARTEILKLVVYFLKPFMTL